MLAAAAPGRHLTLSVDTCDACAVFHPLPLGSLRVIWPQVGKAASTYSASLFSGEGFVTHFTGVACSRRPTAQCGST